MKRYVTTILAAATLACSSGSAAAQSASEGQGVQPRALTTDDLTGSSSSTGTMGGGGQPGSGSRAPTVAITGPASGSAFAVNTPVAFSGSFTDDPGDSHSAQWRFEAITATGIVTESTGSVAGSWTFTTPGVYAVSLTVTDQTGLAGTATAVNGQDAMIVVFDQGAGFATGDGRILSPPGAYAADPLLSGRMDFAFDCKYHEEETTPRGSTLLKLNAGDFEFRSTAHRWLVVSGPRALYTGSGTVNGAGDYTLLLSAVDGDDPGGGGVDRVRIKITDRATGAVVYDNQMGASDTAMATTPLDGGKISVRLPNGGLGHIDAQAGLAPAAEPAGPALGFGLAQNFPNPFRARTEVRFSIPERSHVRLAVYDAGGREVASLCDGLWEAGAHSMSWAGDTGLGGPARGGVYFVRMESRRANGERSFVSTRRMILLQ